jgi:hypothetical protein
MTILCANVMTPALGINKTTVGGLEEEWAVNHLTNFHLLSILSPAIRAQPPDRDARIPLQHLQQLYRCGHGSYRDGEQVQVGIYLVRKKQADANDIRHGVSKVS